MINKQRQDIANHSYSCEAKLIYMKALTLYHQTEGTSLDCNCNFMMQMACYYYYLPKNQIKNEIDCIHYLLSYLFENFYEIYVHYTTFFQLRFTVEFVFELDVDRRNSLSFRLESDGEETLLLG